MNTDTNSTNLLGSQICTSDIYKVSSNADVTYMSNYDKGYNDANVSLYVNDLIQLQ